MAIVVEESKSQNILTNSYVADGDLSARQYTCVVPSAQASGRMKVKAPTGQGVLCIGVLQDTPTDGQMAGVMEEGVSKVVANGAFNAGIELAVAGTNGKVAAAASGDYVIGISREAANAADHKVSMVIKSPYQKN